MLVLVVDIRVWKDSVGDRSEAEFVASWTTPEWEVFMFLGAHGANEPHLLPRASNRKGGSSGPPQRAATKRRRVSRAIAAEEVNGSAEVTPREGVGAVESPLGVPSDSGTSTGRAASGYTLHRLSEEIDAELISSLKSMKSGMDEHMKLMESFRDTDRRKVDMKSIKLMLESFPPGSAEHTKALARLSAISAMDD